MLKENIFKSVWVSPHCWDASVLFLFCLLLSTRLGSTQPGDNIWVLATTSLCPCLFSFKHLLIILFPQQNTVYNAALEQLLGKQPRESVLLKYTHIFSQPNNSHLQLFQQAARDLFPNTNVRMGWDGENLLPSFHKSGGWILETQHWSAERLLGGMTMRFSLPVNWFKMWMRQRYLLGSVQNWHGEKAYLRSFPTYFLQRWCRNKTSQ